MPNNSISINLGPGVAPDITWDPTTRCWVVAVGGLEDGIHLQWIKPDGSSHKQVIQGDGWGFPVVRWPWLAYKGRETIGWPAVLINLTDGAKYLFTPTTGNSPIALSSSHIFWQASGNHGPYTVCCASFSNPDIRTQLGPGAPDGLAWGNPDLTYALGKDIRSAVPGMTCPQGPGDSSLVVGENDEGGIRVKLPNERTGVVLLPGTDTKTPRVARGEGENYGVVAWGSVGVNVVLFTSSDVKEAIPDVVEPTAPTSLTIPALPRKMWIAPFFSHSQTYGDTALPDHVGNAVVAHKGDTHDPDGTSRLMKLGIPMIAIAGTPDVGPALDFIIAWWVSGAHPNDLRTQVEQRLTTYAEKPIIAYLDMDQGWPALRPTWITDRVWPQVQAYRKPGEAIAAFVSRVETELDKVTSYGTPYIALAPRFDDFNGSGSVEATLECMPHYDRWMRIYPVIACMPFSDRRGNGMAKNLALRAWCKAWCEAVVARPNRFDGWTSTTTSIADALANKLGQTVEMVMLSSTEKAFLIKAIKNQAEPGKPPEKPDTPIAPDISHLVLSALRANPGIDMTDETSSTGRARILNLAILAAGGKPWGRKARNRDGSNKNSDALCYLRPDGRHEIYDALNGSNPSKTPEGWVSWSFEGIYKPGENGWWSEMGD